MSQKIEEVDLSKVMRDIVTNSRYHQWLPLGRYGIEVCCVSSGAPATFTRIRRAGGESFLTLPTAMEYEALSGPGGPMYVLSGAWPKISILGQSDEAFWNIEHA